MLHKSTNNIYHIRLRERWKPEVRNVWGTRFVSRSRRDWARRGAAAGGRGGGGHYRAVTSARATRRRRAVSRDADAPPAAAAAAPTPTTCLSRDNELGTYMNTMHTA